MLFSNAYPNNYVGKIVPLQAKYSDKQSSQGPNQALVQSNITDTVVRIAQKINCDTDSLGLQDPLPQSDVRAVIEDDAVLSHVISILRDVEEVVKDAKGSRSYTRAMMNWCKVLGRCKRCGRCSSILGDTLETDPEYAWLAHG